MTDQTKATRRDEVLFAFHRECATPTLNQIMNWTQRYPEFADDIRAHAGIMRDWAADEEAEEEVVDELMMNRARSRALNAIYNAKAAEQDKTQAAPETFDQLLSSAGLDTRQLGRAIDVGRDVLSDLFRGRMSPPIGSRLVKALLDQLKATRAQFDRALAYAQSHPSMGHAKASQQPTIIQCSYEESIQRSSMSPERKSYWLEED